LKRELGIRARKAGQERAGGRAPLIKNKISSLTDPPPSSNARPSENATKRSQVLHARQATVRNTKTEIVNRARFKIAFPRLEHLRPVPSSKRIFERSARQRPENSIRLTNSRRRSSSTLGPIHHPIIIDSDRPVVCRDIAASARARVRSRNARPSFRHGLPSRPSRPSRDEFPKLRQARLLRASANFQKPPDSHAHHARARVRVYDYAP